MKNCKELLDLLKTDNLEMLLVEKYILPITVSTDAGVKCTLYDIKGTIFIVGYVDDFTFISIMHGMNEKLMVIVLPNVVHCYDPSITINNIDKSITEEDYFMKSTINNYGDISYNDIKNIYKVVEHSKKYGKKVEEYS